MRLPSPLLIAAFGVLCGSLIDVSVKHLAGSIPVMELTVWRFVFGAGVALILFAALRRPMPHWEAWRFHAFRSTIHLCSALTFFFGLTQLGLAEATVIGFTAALMIAPIARLLLGEVFGRLSLAAALIGFAGAAITLSAETSGAPEAANRALGAASVLVSALTYAVSVVLLRMRAQKEDAITIVMLANVLPALIGLPLLLASANLPEARNVPSLIGLGLAGVGIWWMFTIAYARAPAQQLAPLEYTSLIWSAGFGFLFFDEVPGWQLYIGAFIIIGACLLVAFESHFASRRQAHVPLGEMLE